MSSTPPLLMLAEGRRPRPRRTTGPVRDRNAEAKVQAAIVAWIRLAAPKVLVFAVPNGGLRSKAEAARMKWTGTVAGVPDLAVVALDGKVFFVEVKAPGGYQSHEQHAIADRLVALRTPLAVCRSVDEVRRAFEVWEIETREVSP